MERRRGAHSAAMARMRAITWLLSACLWACADRVGAVDTTPSSLFLSAAGEASPFGTPEDRPPPWKLPAPWYAVSLQDGQLHVEPVHRTRAPDWHQDYKITDPGQHPPEEGPAQHHALDLPDGALLGVRLAEAADLLKSSRPLRTGNYPSALPVPITLHDRWQASAQVNGQTWHLSTTSQRRKDGALLAGSLSLLAQRDGGAAVVLLPPTVGGAFEREELLWLGSLRASAATPDVDFLLKRTLLTGEVQYLMRIDGVLGTTMFDPDHAYDEFSSGVEAFQTIDRNAQQTRPLPPERIDGQSFAIPDKDWNAALDAASKENLPKTLFDRQLLLDGDKLRITVEYLPSVESTGVPGEVYLSSGRTFSNGPLLVKAHFRGKTQVLLRAEQLDDAFSLLAGMLRGEPAIMMGVPYYNNYMSYDWVWDALQQRFIRLYQAQAQGC